MKIFMFAGLAAIIALIVFFSRTSPVVETLAPAQAASVQPVQPSAAAPVQAPQPTTTAALNTGPANLREGLSYAAQAYEQSSHFPQWSVPLDESQHALTTPDAGAVVERELNPYGLPGRLSVQLSAYRYQPGEMMQGSVILSGPDALFTQVGRIEISLRTTAGKVITRLLPNASLEAQQWLYQVRQPTADDWPEEVNLTAEVFLTDGQSLRQSAPFKVFSPVAEITGIGDQYQQDNELVIPVKIENAEAGYYKLAAGLYYADKKPLAYLQGKARISSSGSIELKAWGSLLAKLPDSQQLWLGSFQLRRIPARPADGEEVRYGTSRKSFYRLDKTDPGDFSDQAFQDEQAAQRLQFLQTLGRQARSS